MNRNRLQLFAIFIPLLCLAATVFYYLPPVHARLAWRVEELRLRAGYALNPPEKVVFTPRQTALPLVTSAVSATATPLHPTPTATPGAILPEPSVTPTPSPAPTLSPTPLPAQVELTGVIYEDQHGRWNYCAPANLSMALTYWGWPGDRDVVGPAIKPVEKDKNVMPYEMVDYVNLQTGLRALQRVGGSAETVKRLIAAGFPVVAETGTYLRDISGVVSWMGHYQLVNGYNDVEGYFLTQDSYIKANHKESYEQFESNWRAFNYTYLIVFPPEREADVLALLGPDADVVTNAQNAARRAMIEIQELTGMDQYFAWFNHGTSLMRLEDYAGAAQSYDEAFKIYPNIPEGERPWRMMWYQTGPYFAYFYAQRYQDVIDLADTTLGAMQGDKNLEESYYWRGMARAKLGEIQAAMDDYYLALEYHPGFGPVLLQLQNPTGQTP